MMFSLPKDSGDLDISMEWDDLFLESQSDDNFEDSQNTSDFEIEMYEDLNLDLAVDDCLSDVESDISVETISQPAVECIENMVLSLLKQLASPVSAKESEGSSEDSEASSSNKLGRSDYKVEFQLVDRRRAATESSTAAMKTIRYPRRSRTGSLKPLAQLFRVLDLAHEALLSGVPATKRDIYYKDVALFKSQRVVDGLVDDIAATLELERSDLNIRSSSKGLICGSGLSITLLSGEVISCNDTEGSLIPAGEDIETFSLDEDVAWVLVVEKEAVFQTLCRLRISQHEMMPGPGLVITGKGYPDVATRHLVKSLADALPRSIPILCLVDGDPYGLDILAVYKYGSRSMQHENEKLATRRIKWLGLWASELAGLGVDKNQLLPITPHDETKALAMLQRPNVSLPGRWRRELQHMLHSRRKAEIEILSSLPENAPTICAPASEGAAAAMMELYDQSLAAAFVSIERPSCNPHALLVRYLTMKITSFVESAATRTSQSQTLSTMDDTVQEFAD